MRRLRFIAGVLGSLALMVGMAGNAAAKGQLTPAVTDCQKHGQLTQNYTVAQLQQALHSMPASVSEYSNCVQVIQQALYKKLGKEKGGTSTTPAASSGGGSGTVIIIVVIVVIVLVGGGGAYFAWRRRGSGGSQPPSGDSA